MTAPGSDSALATYNKSNQTIHDQLELGRSVQDQAMQNLQAEAIAGPGQRAAAAGSMAAPDTAAGKIVAVTVEGIKHSPMGALHALENPVGLLKNAGISVTLGAAARAILPETGMVGKLGAVGLGLYFTEQTALPLYHAYKTGLRARTMGGIKAAGAEAGDAFGNLAVNLPIGIAGYKIGGGSVGLSGRKGGGGVSDSGDGGGDNRGGSPANKPTAPEPVVIKDSSSPVLDGHVEVTERVEKPAETDVLNGSKPVLPERYQPIKETFSGTTVPGISREFLKNLQTDDSGQYYGAGLRYPDIMADPEMAQFINDHNQLTMSAIDKAVYDQELANEAKALSYKLPPEWDNAASAPALNKIDVTDGGDGSLSIGTKTFTLTDEGAPNRKLVMTDALHPGKKKTFIAESPDFEMQQVIAVKANGVDHFAVVGSHEGASVLHMFDQNGKATGEVTLPGYGTLHDVRQGANAGQIQFLYDTPISAPQVVNFDFAAGKSTISPLATDAFNTNDYVTEKLLVPYTDINGAQQTVPAFLSHNKNMVTNGLNPGYYKIYGGFDVGPQYVGYSASTASWLMRGGVAVDPVLPGDGGLGSGNYEEGLGAGIDNTSRALKAIVQKLHDMGITSPETTGLYGRSNGGTVVNHMLNNNSNMVGAAVSESGVNSTFDSPVINVDTGQYWTSEFGDPQSPKDVAWMSKHDVLNNISPATNYPPTLVEIGTRDGVVNVGNGITYHALRQAQGKGEVLLYSRIGEGHDPVDLNLALQTAFLWNRLNATKS